MIRLILLSALLGGIGILVLLGMLIAPRVDEQAGFFTDRALEAIQSYKVNGVPLRRVVEGQLQAVQWRTYHQDVPFQTYVECTGIPRVGEPPILRWYVEERPVWKRGPALEITSMTALSEDAFDLAPHLFDPRMAGSMSPSMIERAPGGQRGAAGQ